VASSVVLRTDAGSMIWAVPGDRLPAVSEGAAMTTTTTTTELVPGHLDVTSKLIAAWADVDRAREPS
jgi:hypothetical protein